ncbi:MAG: hypothetical protein MZV64_13000 [Ignavibacteriales bacterium]|nr:hypothetical protein [Ignavibacteriales bacterium]
MVFPAVRPGRILDEPGSGPRRARGRPPRRGRLLRGFRGRRRNRARRRLPADLLRPPSGGRPGPLRSRRTALRAPAGGLAVADDGVHVDRLRVVVDDPDRVGGLGDGEHHRTELESAGTASRVQGLPGFLPLLGHPEQARQPIARASLGDDRAVVRRIRIVDAAFHPYGHLAAGTDLGEPAVGSAQGALGRYDLDLVHDLPGVKLVLVLPGLLGRGRGRLEEQEPGRDNEDEAGGPDDGVGVHSPLPSRIPLTRGMRPVKEGRGNIPGRWRYWGM